MTANPNDLHGATILVVSTGPDGIPYRAWMRLHAQPRRTRPASRRRTGSVCARCGARASDGIPITLDHIVPRARLSDTPEVRDHPANHQWTCGDLIRPHARPDPKTGRVRYWVARRGCNEQKADGPAVDYRGDPARHRLLLELLADHQIDELVAWEPRPYRGVQIALA